MFDSRRRSALPHLSAEEKSGQAKSRMHALMGSTQDQLEVASVANRMQTPVTPSHGDGAHAWHVASCGSLREGSLLLLSRAVCELGSLVLAMSCCKSCSQSKLTNCYAASMVDADW